MNANPADPSGTQLPPTEQEGQTKNSVNGSLHADVTQEIVHYDYHRLEYFPLQESAGILTRTHSTLDAVIQRGMIDENEDDGAQNGYYAPNETQAIDADNKMGSAHRSDLYLRVTTDKCSTRRGPRQQCQWHPVNLPTRSEPKTALPASARRKHRESVPNAAVLMIEQAQNPKNKVLRTNFLEMYQAQLAKHQRRMSTLQERRNAPNSAPPNRRTGTTEQPSLKDMRPSTAIGIEGEGDDVFEDGSSSRLMADTASSSMRRSPLNIRQKLRRTSVAAMSGMTALHGEVKNLQSFRKFKRESLGVMENDIPNIDDLEEGELFDEMRKCRYIRWGEDEERVTELNQDQPLVNQLKKLKIDTTKKPKRFLKQVKEHVPE